MKAIEFIKSISRDKHVSIHDLASLIKNRVDEKNPNYCCFLGAGASKTSGIYTARELVTSWRRDVYRDLNGEHDEQIDKNSEKKIIEWFTENHKNWYNPKNEYASLFEKKYPLPKHRRSFIEKEVAGKMPSIGYSYLVRLADASFLRTIFTTNFDDLINEAFYQFSIGRPIVCAHDSSVNSVSITSSRANIIKLHGDYLFDGLKCTNLETNCLEKNMSDKFGQFLKEYGLILVGYSGSDTSIMDILNKNILSDQHLQNGLYWCFRNEDCINEDVRNIIQTNKAFIVIVDGFDELMAELYDILCANTLPFNSQIATDKAQYLIDGYLRNDDLKQSKSNVIKKHLEQLEKERKSSEFFSAIQALNSDVLKEHRLKNFEIVKFLKIEQIIQSRDYEIALSKIQDEIGCCEDIDFKKSLLSRLYLCAKNLNRYSIAVDAANEMLRLEGENVYAILDKVAVLMSHNERIEVLNDSIKNNPYNPLLINQLANEKIYIFSYCDPGNEDSKIKEIEDLLEKSISLSPGIRNPAWRIYYDFIDSDKYSKDIQNDKFQKIINEHLKQDPYNYRTSRFVYEYCKHSKLTKYNDIELFSFLDIAFNKHFPKDYSNHFAVLSNACVEFQEYGYLRDLIEKCDNIKTLSDNGNYISKKIQLQLDVYRDIDASIEIGESFLKNNKSEIVEEALLKMYIIKKEIFKAHNLLNKLKGSIDYSQYYDYESDIFENEEKFQDAIDSLKRVPDKEFFHEKYVVQISFMYLKMGEFEKARQTCIDVLQRHNFSNNHQETIINYEFAKLKIGKKVSKERLNKIIANPKNEEIKAVAQLLLGDSDQALKIFKIEMEKRFSKYYQYLRWPVLEGVVDNIYEIGTKLIENKRTLSAPLTCDVYDLEIIK